MSKAPGGFHRGTGLTRATLVMPAEVRRWKSKATVETATEARQGRPGRPVVVVLVVSLSLLVALYVVLFYGLVPGQG